ncbi:MAG TPA: sigma-70 family RNA polymerase sigma factor [Acidimicrobiia bacterium]|jgi:RNA polymerase sigma-70 factor (ECF subfamily)
MDEADQTSAVRLPGHFDAFYRSEYKAVVALMYGLSGSTWVAEDLAQEAFLRAHRDWERVGPLDSPGAWVRRVGINLARSRWRRIRTEAAVRLRIQGRETAIEALTTHDGTFWDEVRKLPSRQAQAIALRYVDDLPVGEIAQIMETAEGTVRALLHQGRGRLERQLVARGWVE